MIQTPYGQFPAFFRVEKLKDLCVDRIGIQTGPFGSQLHNSDYVSTGTPILTVEHLGENRIIHENIPNVTDEDRNRLSQYLIKKGDIIFSRVGSVDRRALVRDDENGWLFSGRCLRVRPDPEKLDSVYLSYFMGLPAFKEYIRKIAVGATMPSINTEILSNIPISYPPLPTQHRIAEILGSLDDKIEFNRQMNETLEAMARTIFQSWFVDFDPVRAKAEGRQPDGMDAATAALFPSGFEEIEGRVVPKGWDVSTIGESVSVQGGSTPSTTNPEFWDEGTVNFATPKDLASLSSPILLSTEKKITSKGVEQISSRILPVGSVLLSSRAPIGYIAMTTIPVAINQGFIAIICNKKIPNYFVINWLELNLQAIIDRANGTTFLEISKSNFRPMTVISPSEDVLKKFTEIVAPIYQKIITNETESQKLIQIRDSLLPKLMSGELPVQGEK